MTEQKIEQKIEQENDNINHTMKSFELKFIPKVIEDIIIDYKNQLEHTEKMDKVLDEMYVSAWKHHYNGYDYTYFVEHSRDPKIIEIKK